MDKSPLFFQAALLLVYLADAISVISLPFFCYSKFLKKLPYANYLGLVRLVIMVIAAFFLVYVAVNFVILPLRQEYAKGLVAYVLSIAMTPTIVVGFASFFVKP